MPDLPDDPSCIVHGGERVTVKRHHVEMPDGTTRTSIKDCKFESGAIVVAEYVERKRERKRAKLPAVVSPTAPEPLPDETTSTALVAALPPQPADVPPEAGASPLTVVLAVGVAGTAGAVALKTMRAKASGGNASQSAQQKDERRQREQCATASDSVMTDFRARTADFKRRPIAEIHEPTALWQRAEALELQVDQLQSVMRAAAKTRRA